MVLLNTTLGVVSVPCIKAAAVCETPRIAVAIHSSGELGIQLPTMLHMSSVLPNLSYAADAHYDHLVDDVIVGGKLAYRDGAIEVPVGPGLGVELDREKLGLYSELFKSMGGYQYDRDPERPGWFALVPNDRWHAVS